MKKISDERLQDMAKNPFNTWDGETIGEVAQELLTRRQQNAELEQKYQNATTYCEEHANFEGYCCVVCLMNERDKLKEQNAELIEDAETLADAVIWCGGSDDFAPDGVAYEGYKKIMADVDQHHALMSRIKGE